MIRFVIFRILSALPLLLVLSLITFVIIQLPPGDYADFLKRDMIARSGASEESAEKQAEAYRAAHGLNDPVPIQYVKWITGIVTRFDFGESFFYNKPVGDVISDRLPRTLILALFCHLLATV